jgi:hypothetical protein|tara:strand:+ start:257 stop:811 length:555 start_codon:yes stop_codon:yes gene_type:complete
MAAIQFPANPNSGDLFTAGNGIRYTYDGEKWKTLGTSTVGTEGQFLESPTTLTINKVIPANTNTGVVGGIAINSGVVLTVPSTSTFRTLLGKSGSGGGSTALPTTGGTMTGFLTLNANPTAVLHAATKQYVDSKEVTIVETPKSLITNRSIGENINAGMMGPTVAINPSITISVGANSLLFVVK